MSMKNSQSNSYQPKAFVVERGCDSTGHYFAFWQHEHDADIGFDGYRWIASKAAKAAAVTKSFTVAPL